MTTIGVICGIIYIVMVILYWRGLKRDGGN